MTGYDLLQDWTTKLINFKFISETIQTWQRIQFGI